MFRSAALLLTDHSSRDSTGQPPLGALKVFMSLTQAPARVPKRTRNLRIIPTTCARPRRRFYLAVQIERSKPTPRYDISRLRNRASHVSAHAIHAHADCSPLHRSTMAEP